MKVLGNVKKNALGGMFVGTLLVMSSLSMTGCLTDDKANDNVSISGLKVTPSSIKAGQTAEIEGSITSKAALTAVKVTVWKGSEEVTTGKGFTVTSTAPGADKLAWNLKSDGTIKIAVAGAATGDYTVKVVAVSGSDSASASADLTVTGTTVSATEFTLGSNQNAAGGSVDLDELKVYKHAEAKDISEKIDLYYAHSATDDKDKLFTPAQAKVSGFGATTNGPATWTTANATEFKAVTISESAFNAITTQEAIDALWTATSGMVDKSAEVSAGATFVVNTDKAKKVLIRVTAYAPGDAGTITVKGTK